MNSFFQYRKTIERAALIGQQSLSVDSSGETPKLPPRVQQLAKHQPQVQQLAKYQPTSNVETPRVQHFQQLASNVESRKMQLEKQRSMDGAVKDRSTNNRGYLMRQMSVDTNALMGRQQKTSQVNLVKQMSMQSVPGTPRVMRKKGVDKRLKKEQGMTVLVIASIHQSRTWVHSTT